MGIRLIVEVLDHAPKDLPLGERLVLIVIAEEANDTTRRGWPPLDVIADRTGLGLRGAESAIRRLRERGYDIRVPLKVGKDGRPVYAWRGRSVTYTVPRFPPRDGPGAQRRAAQAASVAERPADSAGLSVRKARQGTSKGPSVSAERPVSGVGPSPHIPSDPLTPARPAANERPADNPADNGGREAHKHEPNARAALARIRAERRLPLTEDELLALAYEIGTDPYYDGYAAIDAATTASFDTARDIRKVLRARLGLSS